MARISLCSTNYNTEPLTRASLESVLAAVKGLDFEVVITDNFSNDDSYSVLESFTRELPLTLNRLHCSRGRGRQTSFLKSRGDYIATFDLDTIYNQNWTRLLRWVLDNDIQYGLSAAYAQFYPRFVLDEVGGWRDLQYWEDVDLWARLAAKGLYRTYPILCGENLKRAAGRSRIARALRLYARCRDKVATADWISLRLYLAGYAQLLQTSGRLRDAYYPAVFMPAFAAGRLKRRRLWPGGSGPSILADSSLSVDLGLAPKTELFPPVGPFDTKEGCEDALNRGDYGFIPGTYD